MNARVGWRFAIELHSALMAIALASPSVAAPSFISHDPRLPNPDRPYVMKTGAGYGAVVGLDDLTIRVANPAQLDIPTINSQGTWEFDSTFDIHYSAILSIGTAPPRYVIGTGSARTVGIAPGGGPILAPRVYDTELLALDLNDGPSFMFRESPMFQSTGLTTVEDACPACGFRLFSFECRVSSMYFPRFQLMVARHGCRRAEPSASSRFRSQRRSGSCCLAASAFGRLRNAEGGARCAPERPNSPHCWREDYALTIMNRVARSTSFMS